MAEEVRLQKLLSRAGVASRRRAEQLMQAGRVRVNGEPVTELGRRVDPDRDVVEVDGKRVTVGPPVWVALHKPPGYVATRREPGGRPTIYDLLPPEHAGLFHVGRLDADSEGLLLLTNEGDAANRLLHPRYGLDRVYEAEAEGRLEIGVRRRLVRGVVLEDGWAAARTVEPLEVSRPGRTALRVTMREGRKREIRRLFAAVGHPVRRLVRVRFGAIELGSLRPGEWRRLSGAEVRALKSSTERPDAKGQGEGKRRGRRPEGG